MTCYVSTGDAKPCSPTQLVLLSGMKGKGKGKGKGMGIYIAHFM